MVYLRYLIKDNQGNIIYRLLDSQTGYMTDVGKEFIAVNKSKIDISRCTKIHIKSIKNCRTLHTGFNDLETWCRLNKRLDLLAEYSRNNKKSTQEIAMGSSIKVDWVCSKCFHTWSTSVYQRTSHNSCCPCCTAINGRGTSVIRGVNDLFTWASKNNPKLIQEYSPNNKIDIHNIARATLSRVEWVCSKCGHTWEAGVASRTAGGNGCPACASLRMTGSGINFESGVNDLFTWASKNNPILIKEYSANNPIDIHNIARASGREVEWICSKCSHVWKRKVIIRTQSNSGCPACAYRKKAQAQDRKKAQAQDRKKAQAQDRKKAQDRKGNLYDWASKNKPTLIKEYSPNNKISINELSQNSNELVEWVCSK